MDLSFLNWLVPLVAGAALTFGFGALDSTLKYRRETRAVDAANARALAETQRVEARAHAVKALELASRIRDQVTPPPRHLGEPEPLEDISGAQWDRDEMRQLRDLGILIPDATVREIIATATTFVTSSTLVADGCRWEYTPREIQLRSMIRLREVIAAFLRIEPINPETVDWFRTLKVGYQEMWEEIQREARAHAERSEG